MGPIWGGGAAAAAGASSAALTVKRAVLLCERGTWAREEAVRAAALREAMANAGLW